MGRQLSVEKIDVLRSAFERGISIIEAAKMAQCHAATARRYINGWRSGLAPSHRPWIGGHLPNIASPRIVIEVGPDLKSALIDACVARRSSISGFVGALLETIISENLIPAIMDE